MLVSPERVETRSGSAPLYTTLFARPFLGEHVGMTRALLVVGGFIGVLIVTHPANAGSGTGIAWALTGALLYAASALLTRRIGKTDRPPTTMLYSMTVYAVLSAVVLPFVWSTPTPTEWAGFLAIGVLGGLAQFLLFQAYRQAPASTVAPFEYTILAWGILWGFLIWHELPDVTALFGIAIIAAAGLILVRHEHRGRQRPSCPE